MPKHSGSRPHGRGDWEESLLAASHCASGTPAGLSQDGVADLMARRRGRVAGEHQLVHEIAALEDSSVDASVVLQNPKFVPRAFRFCRCLEEPGRCPAGFVHAEKTPKPSGTVAVLEHSGLRGGSVSVAGAAAHAVVSLPACASTLPSPFNKKKIQTTATPVALTEFVQSPHESVLSFEKKTICGSGQTIGSRVLLHCRQETTLGFHAERLSRVCASKDTLRDVPRYVAAKLSFRGTCRRKLCKPSASCSGGLEKLVTCY